jgi:hypothetical protein
VSYRVPPERDVGSREWLERLAARGRPSLVRVALTAARAALPVWESAHPDVAEPRVTIDAIATWLRGPTAEGARALVELTYRRGDPDDIDGWWFCLDDGTMPEMRPTEAYLAADRAGNCVYAPRDYAVEPALAAIQCARRAGVPETELTAALESAAKRHELDYEEPASLPNEPRIGHPDRSRASEPCPECGGRGFPIGPKVTTAEAVHRPYRCDACGRDFDVRR